MSAAPLSIFPGQVVTYRAEGARHVGRITGIYFDEAEAERGVICTLQPIVLETDPRVAHLFKTPRSSRTYGVILGSIEEEVVVPGEDLLACAGARIDRWDEDGTGFVPPDAAVKVKVSPFCQIPV